MQAQNKSGKADTHGVGRWLVLAGVWLIYFSFGVTIASMAPLVGPISAELGIGNSTMGAILGAWPLTGNTGGASPTNLSWSAGCNH